MDVSLSKLRETVKAREAWCATGHGITKSWTQLSDWTTTKPLERGKKDFKKRDGTGTAHLDSGWILPAQAKAPSSFLYLLHPDAPLSQEVIRTPPPPLLLYFFQVPHSPLFLLNLLQVFLKHLINYFIFSFWWHLILVAMHKLSLVAACRLLIEVASLIAEPRLWSTGSVVWCMGSIAPWHVKSSQARDKTCVPCIGRRILNHWTSREVWYCVLK